MIWTLNKYVADGAVGSLVNSNYSADRSCKKPPNAKYVHIPVPAGKIFRLPYTDSPRMPKISIIVALKPIRKGEEILVSYGHTYTQRYFESGHDEVDSSDDE